MKALATIKKVNIREVWPSEERDFTPWLAEKGIKLLAEELGLPDIKVLETEAEVGQYRADILAIDESLGEPRKIIIENQFGKTDHNHLGKLLTYAAGQDASIVIWITEEVTDEHRSVIDWLNRIAESSDLDVGFFLVKIEVWRIENSPPAPKFTIVSSPNNWSKTIKTTRTLGEKSLKSFEFIKGMVEYIKNNSNLKVTAKPSPHTPSAYSLPLGVSEASLTINVSSLENVIKVGVYLVNKESFYLLKKHKEEIEREFGSQLVWDDMKEQKGAKIYLERKDFDVDDSSRRLEYYEWIKQQLEKFYPIFRKWLKEVKNNVGKSSDL